MLSTFIELIFLFFFSLMTLFTMRKVAQKIGLTDQPSARKLHHGAIPLVGGISIAISQLYFFSHNPLALPHSNTYGMCLIILVTVGALDDKYDISFKLRFLVQACISIAMMQIANIELKNLGDILGTGEVVTLGWLGYIVTILAVVGAINAFNMVDGIDGLLGGLAIVTYAGLGVMLALDGQFKTAYFCLVNIIIVLPYILLNLGAFGRKRKVFMGDAGSMLIGFNVIWLLLISSQNGSTPPLRPVTALWLIALPLMDMVAIMIRRIQRGSSPFKPDREHLHHIFQRLGFTSNQTLVVICVVASFFATFGIYAEIKQIPEYIMFYSFIIIFLIYLFLLNRIWKVTSAIRRWKLFSAK